MSPTNSAARHAERQPTTARRQADSAATHRPTTTRHRRVTHELRRTARRAAADHRAPSRAVRGDTPTHNHPAPACPPRTPPDSTAHEHPEAGTGTSPAGRHTRPPSPTPHERMPRTRGPRARSATATLTHTGTRPAR
ncbi:hypothetical protein RSA3_06105 [Microbacterium testaceum]|uniref:Uncharacterized protein n=1 Tax=Microbacterium testaceum TaxID=2033 RepID=A0A147F9Q6_MICTE|nr:hypothetical protein RSA3_06105 [Microbacterium testaceum]